MIYISSMLESRNTRDILFFYMPYPKIILFLEKYIIQTLVNASVLIKASQNMYTKLLIEPL